MNSDSRERCKGDAKRPPSERITQTNSPCLDHSPVEPRIRIPTARTPSGVWRKGNKPAQFRGKTTMWMDQHIAPERDGARKRCLTSQIGNSWPQVNNDVRNTSARPVEVAPYPYSHEQTSDATIKKTPPPAAPSRNARRKSASIQGC